MVDIILVDIIGIINISKIIHIKIIKILRDCGIYMVTYILKLSRSPIFFIGNDNIQSDQSLRFFHSIKL